MMIPRSSFETKLKSYWNLEDDECKWIRSMQALYSMRSSFKISLLSLFNVDLVSLCEGSLHKITRDSGLLDVKLK